MKKVQRFISDDGKEFSTPEACRTHETTVLVRRKLEQAIGEKLDSKFKATEDSNDFYSMPCFAVQSRVDLQKVMNALLDNASKIASILGTVKTKKKSNRPKAAPPSEGK